MLDVSQFHANQSLQRGIQSYYKKCGKENIRWIYKEINVTQ